ncbi:hypothetical protein B0H19DRAFT_950741 [Mycena capillaripes]|nr:hypothetical protein B0H19DRAFT_950741 [Mycena capillaripes]
MALNLVARGIPFNTFSRGPPPASLPIQDTQAASRGLGLRSEGFQGNLSEYALYESIRNRIFRSERGRSALMMGGVVSRLAVGVVSPQVVCSGPNKGVHLDGQCFWDGVPTSPSYWDDSFTPQELDIICGVYEGMRSDGKQKKYSSWWPSAHVWESSGLNMGYWTPFCEQWFQSRQAEIRTGTALLHDQAQWRQKLGTRIPPLSQTNERLAAAFLAESGTRIATDDPAQKFPKAMRSQDPLKNSSDRFYFTLTTQRPDSPTLQTTEVETPETLPTNSRDIPKPSAEAKQGLKPDIQRLTRQYWDTRRKIATLGLRGNTIEQRLRNFHVKDRDIYLASSGTPGEARCK